MPPKAGRWDFNPRSPRGGATATAAYRTAILIFQSTLPTRGSDPDLKHHGLRDIVFQSTLPTRGSDKVRHGRKRSAGGFQSTLPTRGSDMRCSSCAFSRAAFQSTLPTRGSDSMVFLIFCSVNDFNPRSPRGGATRPLGGFLQPHKFQSTLPTRGSDDFLSTKVRHCSEFQSTLPTRGSDTHGVFAATADVKFQSTLPTRGSDAIRCGGITGQSISIHAPHEGERHAEAARTAGPSTISIHAPHEGERLYMPPSLIGRLKFQSTLPTRGSDVGDG